MNGGTVTGLPVRPLDHAQREAKRLIGNAVARAHGYTPTDDHAGACDRCGGDGCLWCQWTGEQPK